MTPPNSVPSLRPAPLLQKPLFLSRAVLTGLADATWTEEHSATLEHFAQDPSEPILTIFIDPCVGLKLDLGMPVQVRTPLSQTPGCAPGELRVLPSLSSVSLISCARGLLSLSVSAVCLAAGYREE